MPEDYKYTDELDLAVEDGDFVVVESTTQHHTVLLVAQKGELRQYPLTGVGASTFLNDQENGDLFMEIQSQFEADGMVIKKLVVNQDGTVEVNASYK